MGITTMFSLFQSVVDNRLSQPIYFVQCMRNSQHHPLKQETQDLAQQGSNVTVHRCYSEPAASDRPGEDYNTKGRLNLEVLQQLLPDNDCEFYFTGPVGFMRHVRTMLHKPDRARVTFASPSSVNRAPRAIRTGYARTTSTTMSRWEMC